MLKGQSCMGLIAWQPSDALGTMAFGNPPCLPPHPLDAGEARRRGGQRLARTQMQLPDYSYLDECKNVRVQAPLPSHIACHRIHIAFRNWTRKMTTMQFVFTPCRLRLRPPADCRLQQASYAAPAAGGCPHAQLDRRQRRAHSQPHVPSSRRRCPLQCRAQADEGLAEAPPSPLQVHSAGEDAAVFDPASQSATSWAAFTAVLAVVLAILYQVRRAPDALS